ncbi:hypothetical protein NUU61_006510 [Penicillium alfredii]|uniref:Uncharacterized protein n=1 Tax=Penicillium alfredii TaxID=1506179 RepID=A0A9W9F145_9EURO|nr:uncharacterized protein NUU61_006510 [Penicillium alfredii]KAJ5091640.1 hypothetical protein NUU61_006510 [Penicillium alfredii]
MTFWALVAGRRRARDPEAVNSLEMSSRAGKGRSKVDVYNPQSTPPDIRVTATPQSETDRIVHQLAALAAIVSHSLTNVNPDHGTPAASESTLSPILPPTLPSNNPTTKPEHTTTQSKWKGKEPEKEEKEEESFHHLSSLITISCLPPHSSNHSATPSTTTVASRPGSREIQAATGRKRTLSRFSSHLGDIPKLPFPSRVARKPCPRYSSLPPVYMPKPKPLGVRPEVRF